MALAMAGAQQDEIVLPPLRDDLRLMPGPDEAGGAPTWLVLDPVRNLYTRIGYLEYQMLVRWSLGHAQAVAEAVARDTVLAPTTEDVERFIQFLRAQMLVRRQGSQDLDSLNSVKEARRKASRISITKMLFIRMPLVRPDKFLTATLPIARLFAGPVARFIILTLGLIGIFLVSRQWELFVQTFMGFLSLEGALWLAVTLTAIKILHELGHAYTAKHYGCRVPAMGVALMIFYPVLYTDTSDAWRLREPRKRFHIAAAGISVELAVALLATFAWSFMPPGPAKSAVFLLASATWITTLAINLNPFMRFDGYYLLADWMDIANLQNRGFAMGRWYLRRTLLGLRHPPPEPATAERRRFFILYAYATWLYRFFLFLGIALLVYHMFFKVVGIAMFLIEIVFLLGMPIFKELKEWWKLRSELTWNRHSMTTVAVLALLVGAMVWPWHGTLTVPAVLTAERVAPVTNAMPGRIVDQLVENGDVVEQGQVLFRMQLPDLTESIRQIELQVRISEIAVIQARVNQRTRAELLQREQEHARNLAGLRRLHSQEELLTIRAEFAGVVRDIPSGLQPGIWMVERQGMGVIVADAPPKLVGYADEEALRRLEEGARLHFVPEIFELPVIEATVADIDPLGATVINEPYLIAELGGSIQARLSEQQTWVPLGSAFRVTATPENAEHLQLDRVIRGVAKIDGPAESFVQRIWRTGTALVIRESGF